MHVRPICIDLFAGAGGMSLGFEQAGFDVACAVEIDPVHCAVHKYNFPGTAVLCRSVEDVDGRSIRDAAGIGGRRVAAVIGGSPCQGFSMIGKRSLDDPRNALVGHFMRVVTDLEPDYFVLENVRGLTVGKHREFLTEVVESFDSAGYDVVLPWKVLNAAWYGVPQHRERLFLMGSRRGRGLLAPVYPDRAFNKAGDRKPLPGLPSGPSVSDALRDLPDAEGFEELLSGDMVATALGVPSPYSTFLRGISRDPSDYSHPRPRSDGSLTSSARAGHTPLTRQRFAATPAGTVEPVSRFLRLDPNGVCNTLRAGTGRERGAFTAARPIHPWLARCVTVREMARLHSYPDWFRFNWTKWHGAREVGNSVPPILARAVASSIMSAMGASPSMPEAEMPLGDESLLRLDASAAAALFV